jgi:hypothetical protein
MSSKYDLVIIYIHKASGRIIKIDDYYKNQTLPIFTPNSIFVIYRKSKLNIDADKNLYNYSYVWTSGVYYIPDMITDKRIKEIELEKLKIDAIEELWLDILTSIEQYKATNLFNPLIEKISSTNRNAALDITVNFSRTIPLFCPKSFEEQDIKDKLTKEGFDELCKRCYIMFTEISNKIQESENPYETFKQARRSYFYPIFEQTGTEPLDETT